jgi:acyl-CoA thioester hydrolase
LGEDDDELRMTVTASMSGRARLRFDVEIEHPENDRPVCRGYTVHAVSDPSGKPIRPPRWLIELMRPDAE